MSTFSSRLRSRFKWPTFAVAAALVIVAVLVLYTTRASAPTASPAPAAARPERATDGRPAQQTMPADAAVADPAAYQVQRLRSLPAVAPGPRAATIAGEAAQQPDLYAAEFVRRLLSHDFRTPRSAHLRWVQAESAVTREPLVVGLIPPEFRDRYAVFSVTDAADTPAPIPTDTEWEVLSLQHGYTTVTIERVEEPIAWTNAVASGRISDPGITGRDVTATVVRHTTVDGERRTAKFSVAVSLNLEGPPTRPTWGFVAVISYTAIQVS